MMVTFVSQCEKNALKKTRKVLDAFANRIGDNTWQTLITQDGLNTVQKLLRQSASRSTAVSCHWIRSRSRSQFLWVVGNKNKFNSEGIVAVNWTEKDLLSRDHQNNWKYLPLIKALVGMAGLLHDWGKSSDLFQKKLNPNTKKKLKGDPLRHEWVSCLLLKNFIEQCENKSDEAWLSAICEGQLKDASLNRNIVKNGTQALTCLPRSAALISWLILSHHRMPLPKRKDDCNDLRNRSNASIDELLSKITQDWGYQNEMDDFEKLVEQCFSFKIGKLTDSEPWMKALQHRAKDLLHHLPLIEEAFNTGCWQAILHHARLSLMLGDHYYSSKGDEPNWENKTNLFANTDRKTKALKQKLDEHLIGVTQTAINTVKMLPYIESELSLVSGLDSLRASAKTPKKFKWQDKAVTRISEWRKETNNNSQGYFAVNMASTGCGKTIANAKVMQAISEDAESFRFVLALGLRTLTLQTGDEYKNKIGLRDFELAVLIGSKAIYDLHQTNDEPKEKKENTNSLEVGSESLESLSDSTDELHWQGILPEEELTTVLTSEKDRKLIYAPVLACTIDHLMSATETKRGGRYILPSLRLMSSDLVIDEIDDFTDDDLIAIGRLVYLAGMLGSKVMISSATIPPDLALGYFNAYRLGFAQFAASRDINSKINTLWIDEFNTQAALVGSDDEQIKNYQSLHNEFITKRVKKLKAQPAKRRALIYPCPKDDKSKISIKEQYFTHLKQAMFKLHQQHAMAFNHKTISFGVVRLANINPCVEFTKYLMECDLPENTDIRVMPYHSQQVLLLRHAQEKHLDSVLKRKEAQGEMPAAFSDPVIQAHIENSTTKNILFVLVATPVEEVGRDHDFDWAVIEPSSLRSIIQMAGRVWRHREAYPNTPNIAIMQFNWKGFEAKADRVFCRPGYEVNAKHKLPTHDLLELIDEAMLLHSVDAIARIQKGTKQALNHFAELEHKVIAELLGVEQIQKSDIAVPENLSPRQRARLQLSQTTATVFWSEHLHGHLKDNWLLTALPQQFKRFRNSAPSINLYLVADEDSCTFHEKDGYEVIPVEKIMNIQKIQLTEQQEQRLWFKRDYSALLNEHSKENENNYHASLRFGELSFTDWGETKYLYNDQLGLFKA